MGDYVEQTLGAITRVEAQFKPRVLPLDVIEVDLLRQLDETKRVLHGFKPAMEAHKPVRRELHRAVVQMEAMARDHWWTRNNPRAKWEHFLESLLDVRWWTMVAALQEGEEFTGVEIAFLIRDKGVSPYHRHSPSYGFEQTTECRNIFGDLHGDMAKLEAIKAIRLPSFAVVGTPANSVYEVASPLIHEELTLDLTQDVLGVSRTGSWVIRTSYQGVSCALKRVTSNSRPVLARLSHPHVVQLMHYWRKEKYLFLMMELMDGDLTDVLKKAKGSLLSLPVAVDILLQTARAMLYLHDMGVTYQSLSCANVLFRDGTLLQDGHMEYIIKLAGGGYNSMKSDFGPIGKTRDVHRFGSLCLEVLNERPQREDSLDNIVLEIPEATPQILRFCITSCFENTFSFGFEQVVILLLLAKCQVLKGRKDEAVGSQGCETVQLGLDCAGASAADADFQEYPLYQLYPEPDVSNLSTTLIFFHGFAKSPDEWKSTWMTRNREHVWPEAWLPKDLPQVNVRMLSLSYDTDASGAGEDVGAVEIAKKVLRQLLSSKWNLADPKAKVVLIGHSFGGLIIKRLVVEAYTEASIRSEKQESCVKFLENLKGIVFYGVPGSTTAQNQQFEEYITKLNETGVLRRSSLLQALLKDRRSFNQEMQVLGSLFEKCVPEKTRILHFIEGKGMKKIFGKQVVVSDASASAPPKNVVFHELKEDSHFEVCRPVSKDHKGYKILVEEFLKDIVLERGSLNPETGGREYHQLEDVPHDSKQQRDDEAASTYTSFSTLAISEEQAKTIGTVGSTSSVQSILDGLKIHAVPEIEDLGAAKKSCLQEVASPISTSRKTLSSSFESSITSWRKSQRLSAEQSSPGASKTASVWSEPHFLPPHLAASGWSESSSLPTWPRPPEMTGVKQYRGVNLSLLSKKYRAGFRPRRSRKKIWLGTFGTAEEAARAYDIGILCCKDEKLPLNFADSPSVLNRIFSNLSPEEALRFEEGTLYSVAEVAKKVAGVDINISTSDDETVEQKNLDHLAAAITAARHVYRARLQNPAVEFAAGSARFAGSAGSAGSAPSFGSDAPTANYTELLYGNVLACREEENATSMLPAGGSTPGKIHSPSFDGDLTGIPISEDEFLEPLDIDLFDDCWWRSSSSPSR